ncbi:MAG: ATP-binding protein [Melioribacteraceae bacterium]
MILIFLVVATLVISSALYELNQNKKEMYGLMAEQSHTLLETSLIASQNALLSYEELDKQIKNRLLSNANIVKLLYEQNEISNNLLKTISKQNNFHRIKIFNNKGKKIFQSHKESYSSQQEETQAKKMLAPIFSEDTNILILGINKPPYGSEYKYTIALSTEDRSAIVLNIDAEELLDFRKKIGFGVLLKKVTLNSDIIYAALQDSSGILAASGNVQFFEDIKNSLFLSTSLSDSTFAWRKIEFDSLNIFEAVHPLTYKKNVVGLFRLGLSLEPMQAINSRIKRRLIISGVILFILGSLLLTYIFTKQNFNFLKKQFKSLEAYSDKIIQNVSDSVIVIDKKKKVKIFNTASAKLFSKDSKEIIGVEFSSLFNPHDLKEIYNSDFYIKQIEISINNQKKYLLISKSNFETEEGSKNTVLVIRDLTEQKLLEEKIQRKERLVAMGELASGVAHEVRNPLNTIGTIAQQLNKDFEPKHNEEEFKSLTQLVNKEVIRINETVQSFLQFAKPQPIKPVEFYLQEIIDQIAKQYESMLKGKSIELNIQQNWNGKVTWDRNQIQQVLMNLIQNAYDTIEEKGTIRITINIKSENRIEIKVTDSGKGIPKHILNKIFNLYFTTKAKGTGIGLSIVQQIVYEHEGTILVESEEGSWTTFIINLPTEI